MTPSARRVGPRALGRVLRVASGLGLMTWLLVVAEPRLVLASFARVHGGWIAVAVALVIVDRLLMAYRWLLLLRTIEPGRSVPIGAVLRVFFVSTFLGTFLPTSVGGDAVRTVQLSRLDVPPADAFASVLVDRLLGVLSLLLLAAAGLTVVHERLDSAALLGVALGLAIVVAVALLLLFDARVLSGLVRWLTARRLRRFGSAADRTLAAIRQYGQHRWLLVAVLAASVLVQVLRALQAWCLGLALGLSVSLIWYLTFVPIIALLMALPISVMGLGTSQLGFQVLFGRVGVTGAEAWALSVLFLALGAVGNLPGGWLFTFGAPTRSRAMDSQSGAS